MCHKAATKALLHNSVLPCVNDSREKCVRGCRVCQSLMKSVPQSQVSFRRGVGEEGVGGRSSGVKDNRIRRAACVHYTVTQHSRFLFLSTAADRRKHHGGTGPLDAALLLWRQCTNNNISSVSEKFLLNTKGCLDSTVSVCKNQIGSCSCEGPFQSKTLQFFYILSSILSLWIYQDLFLCWTSDTLGNAKD